MGTWRRRGLTALALAATLLASGCFRSSSDADAASELVKTGLEAQAEGDAEEAARSHREALVHDPNNKFAHYNLGLIEQQAGRPRTAELYYRHTLVLDPAFAPALFNLAIVLTPTAPEEAGELYKRLVELQPEYAAAHLNYGFLLRDLGDEDAAREHLERAVELDPSLLSRVGDIDPPDESPDS